MIEEEKHFILRAALAALAFYLLAKVALATELLAPNGLGVQGGKAKLLLLAHGLPQGFMNDEAYAPYQQGYPPGLAALALLVLAVFGLESTPLLQLLVPLALAMLFLVLAKDARKFSDYAVALLVVISPLAQKLAVGMYAEPFAALCLAVGLRRLRARAGSWWIGLAALFRPEGLLLAALTTLVGARPVPALLPGILWQLFARSLGAGLYDYDFPFGITPGRIAASFNEAFDAAFLHPVANGALAYWYLLKEMRERNARRLAMVVSALVLGLVLIAFNTSPHYDWVVRKTIPRYLFLVLIALPCRRPYRRLDNAAP